MTKKERRTQAAAADALGISAQAIGVWARKTGAPIERVRGRTLCLWPAFPRWREEKMRETLRRQAAPSTLDEARLRRETADAELRELELAERRGELMTVSEGERLLGDAFARVRSKLLNLPNAIQARVTADAPTGRLAQAQAVVDEVMRELAGAEDVPEAP